MANRTKEQKTPLLEALKKYTQRKPVRLHVPGHAGGRGLMPDMSLANLARWDVTEITGMDDLHNPTGAIARAQELAAGLYGARHTFFLVNGTTVGIQALIAATCGENDGIVLPRNVHRSVLGGLVVSGARPLFLKPDIVPGFGFAAGFGPEKLKALLDKEHRVKAVMAVHPVYYGVVGDLAGVHDLCRQREVPLLVDEAHGSHLRFHPRLPDDALSLGADAVVQSVHKTGGALTQASWLHLGTGKVDKARLAEALRLLQTTSPSYILLASLDAARAQLAEYGETVLGELLETVNEAGRMIDQLPGLRVLRQEHLGSAGAKGHDPSRMVISVSHLGLSGYEVLHKLAVEYGVYVEMADSNNVVAVFSLGACRGQAIALAKALGEISRRAGTGRSPVNNDIFPTCLPLPPQVLTPRRAWLTPRREVLLGESSGKISGEIIAVYPPGIAAVYPGEEITVEIVEYLMQVRNSGIHFQGTADPTLRTIKVLDY